MSCADTACTANHDHEHEEVDIDQQIEDSIKELALGEKIRAVAINSHLAEKKALDEELQKKIQALTLEYEQKSIPIYAKTQEVVQGRIPTEEELKDLEKYLKAEEKEQVEGAKKEEPLVEYWLKAMKSNDVLAMEVKEQDEAALKTLTKVEYVLEDAKKFHITFTFGANDYFTNTELKKTVELDENEEPTKTTGTTIEWKEGKNTTVKVTKKTQKNKKTGVKRVVERETKIESFFNFFSDSSPTDAPEEEDEEKDEQAMDGDRLNIDFDIARSLIDEVIPYSLEYFLGIKTGGEDHDDEEIDMDDLDEEEIAALQKEYAAKTGKKAPAGGANDKKDCKQ